MKYIVFFIVFIGIHTSCFSGCFHAKDGVLIIDSLVKRWKYFEKNEIIDSLKKIGVKMSVGKPYKVGFATLTDITIEKASYFHSIFDIQNLKIVWNDHKQNGKVVENSSEFSFSISYKQYDLEQLIAQYRHPYFAIYNSVIDRYGETDEIGKIGEIENLHTMGNEELLRVFKRIRNQDEDKIEKEDNSIDWIKKVNIKGKEYIYSIGIDVTYEHLLHFSCGWSKSL